MITNTFVLIFTFQRCLWYDLSIQHLEKSRIKVLLSLNYFIFLLKIKKKYFNAPSKIVYSSIILAFYIFNLTNEKMINIQSLLKSFNLKQLIHALSNTYSHHPLPFYLIKLPSQTQNTAPSASLFLK